MFLKIHVLKFSDKIFVVFQGAWNLILLNQCDILNLIVSWFHICHTPLSFHPSS